MPWTPQFTSRFTREYRRLSKETQHRVDEAIKHLLTGGDPRRLGVKKHGVWENCYGYPIGRRDRILYEVNSETREITFHRVGPHTIYEV